MPCLPNLDVFVVHLVGLPYLHRVFFLLFFLVEVVLVSWISEIHFLEILLALAISFIISDPSLRNVLELDSNLGMKWQLISLSTLVVIYWYYLDDVVNV